MTRTTTYLTLTGIIIADTGKAIRFTVTAISGHPLEKPVTHWFPVSQISKMFKDPNTTGSDWIMVAEWLCKSKELV